MSPTPRGAEADATPRRAAFAVLQRLDREPVDLQAALDQAFRQGAWDPRDRRLATELTFGVARRRFAIDPLIRHLTGRRLKDLDRATRTLLRLGLYQLLYMDRTPARVALAETVRLAGDARRRGFVNGVLRAADGGAQAPPAADETERFARDHALPGWLAQRWLADFGPEGAAARAAQANGPAPLTLRVNGAVTRREALAERLCAAGCEVTGTAVAAHGLTVRGGGPVPELPGFAEGAFYVQDEASQLVGELVGARPGERILDACAAPGGKASQLAEAVGPSGQVVALEQDARRMERLRANLDRLRLGNVTVARGDAATIDGAALGAPFDRVLLDAPCSGLGVLNRHPEGKWWKSAEAVAACAASQGAILAHVAAMVRPGGSLVYAVCTGERSETVRVVADFLATRPDFAVVRADLLLGEQARPLTTAAGFLDSNGNALGMDGFFAAHLTKKSC
ncbi:MAG: 16S rRNA (cytosine(967)-C(5))-methyltransferase RsmB [Nitrospirae bacterium]|nr:16S rRNA (cytosine(967)-C(5))-methyltransferase RsmB [Nitrospirota bacterium]